MSSVLELQNLIADPGDEWRRMLNFVDLGSPDLASMAQTVEPLFRRGPELVVDTYNYLNSVPETAAILGWEAGINEAHLEERRRFFTVWLARTLGMDTGEDFAHYLFRAGKFHAGHGPRKIHTPSSYITASIGLVLATFSRFLSEEGLAAEVIAKGVAGWTKYLSVQLHLMLLGYQVARDFEQGKYAVKISLYGRMRPLVGQMEIHPKVNEGENIGNLLTKFFNYFPKARREAMERRWRSTEKPDSKWIEVLPSYVLRQGWRVLLNGRDIEYNGGFEHPVEMENNIALFPPGR